jgi:hypothetical protein
MRDANLFDTIDTPGLMAGSQTEPSQPSPEATASDIRRRMCRSPICWCWIACVPAINLYRRNTNPKPPVRTGGFFVTY